MTEVIVAKNLNTFIGSAHILVNVTFRLFEGEVLCLLGRNGVGKSSVLKSLVGIYPPFTGSLNIFGKEMVVEERSPTKANQIIFKAVQAGLGYVPEDKRLFLNLSVQENLEVARVQRPASWKMRFSMNDVFQLFPVLMQKKSHSSKSLSGGEKQMLAIGRALMTQPKILLLDEPSEGLAPNIVHVLKEQIRVLQSKGLTIILAEQNYSFVKDIGDRVCFLDRGSIRDEISMPNLKKNPDLANRFLSV